MTKTMVLPKLYPIIDRATLEARGITVGDFARELAAAGVGMVQYRDKRSAPLEVLRAAAEVSSAFAGRECVLVMNDRADLAVLAGWSAVHVGQGDLPVADARRVLGSPPTLATMKPSRGRGTPFVGLSTHSEKQVLRLAALAQDDNVVSRDQGPDYIAIGPVFVTGTKADAEPVVGLEGVRRARTLTERPLVAIGGITRENARSVIDAGADSVAVIGGLFVEGMTVQAVVEDFLERMR